MKHAKKDHYGGISISKKFNFMKMNIQEILHKGIYKPHHKARWQLKPFPKTRRLF